MTGSQSIDPTEPHVGTLPPLPSGNHDSSSYVKMHSQSSTQYRQHGRSRTQISSTTIQEEHSPAHYSPHSSAPGSPIFAAIAKDNGQQGRGSADLFNEDYPHQLVSLSPGANLSPLSSALSPVASAKELSFLPASSVLRREYFLIDHCELAQQKRLKVEQNHSSHGGGDGSSMEIAPFEIVESLQQAASPSHQVCVHYTCSFALI